MILVFGAPKEPESPWSGGLMSMLSDAKGSQSANPPAFGFLIRRFEKIALKWHLNSPRR